MLIYLLRHGLTAYNAEKRYQGSGAVAYIHLTLPTNSEV